MILNPLLFPALLLWLLLFGLGSWAARRVKPWLLWGPALLCLGVTFLFPLAYARLLDHNLWYLNFRFQAGTELLSALAGFGVAALLMRKPGKQEIFLAASLSLGLTVIPFLKPLVFPLLPGSIKNQWRGNSCIQSTLATCGPCTMATLMKHGGKSVTEEELARDAYTYGRGTENWYLRRAVEKRGFRTTVLIRKPQPRRLPYPALAGTQLGGPGGAGHFIAVLGPTKSGWRISDPLVGEIVLSEKELKNRYFFTGFFMTISPYATKS